MNKLSRRKFLKATAQAAATAAIANESPPAIRAALAVNANNETKSIRDVKHIVILMQENRSFDHYFGAMRGTRGFGDRFPTPLESGKPVWFQSNGSTEVPPFHLDKDTMNASLIDDTPHNFPDQQGAWNQGKLGYWPLWKTDVSMGYYKRGEAPFQWALADAFTLCDHYFCSLRSATDPNRIFLWSGSNVDPARRQAGLNSDMSTAEVVNLRCWITGKQPAPGYTYYGSPLPWKSIPEVLEAAGISWRIYQDPNDNWTGAMNGALAFAGIRNALPGSSIHNNALSAWSVEDLKKHALSNSLPAVSWICPSQLQSEHPAGPSSPARGGDFTHQVLEALTANPDSWSKTVLFVMFDENDGLFDHVPSPAVPSYNLDGTQAGKSTVDLAGMYFETGGDVYHDPLYSRLTGLPDVSYPLIDPRDTVSGNIRPWGMGARVPMYVISPWSKGGWVNSQVFDHSSVGQFIEKRFGVTIPAISPWTRAVSGDLTSVFDFINPNDPKFPRLPDVSQYEAIEAASKLLPAATPPRAPQALFQEPGTRYSRALPYQFHTHARASRQDGAIELIFRNTGEIGAVFHVYNQRHLDRIPRRYTVEAGHQLSDCWDLSADSGAYDLGVYGPNGYFRRFMGTNIEPQPEIEVQYQPQSSAIKLRITNPAASAVSVIVTDTAYGSGGPWFFKIGPMESVQKIHPLRKSGRWYDFTISLPRSPNYERRVAGRVENGKHSHSDPVLAIR
jgi:phospholipase C